MLKAGSFALFLLRLGRFGIWNRKLEALYRNSTFYALEHEQPFAGHTGRREGHPSCELSHIQTEDLVVPTTVPSWGVPMMMTTTF